MRRGRGLGVGLAVLAGSLLSAPTAPVDAEEPVVDEGLPPEVQYRVARAEAELEARERLPFELPDEAAAAQPSSAAEGGGPSVTVTPDTDLVHDQVVTVRGQGWAPQDIVLTLQCLAGPAAPQNCRVIDFGQTGAQGRFTAHVPVDVILATENQVGDCRVVSCLVGAAGFGPSGAVRIRLAEVTFDPAGPDPTRHTVTASPTTGLVDGDRIDFAGDGFPVDEEFGEGFAQAVLCRSAPATVDDCDLSQGVGVFVESSGHLEGQIFVSPILELPGGPVDCRVTDCVLAVASEDFLSSTIDLAEAALVPLEFDPDAPLRPPPTLVADPSTGLVDGDLVHLDGEGFDPERFFTVQQCIADPEDIGDCEGGLIRFGFTGPDAQIDGFIGVRATFRTWLGQRVDCRLTACSIVVAHGDLGRHAEAVLEFDPDGPLLEPTLEVEPSTGLADGDTVQVTGTGFRPDLPVVVGQCPAGVRVDFECDESNIVFLEPDVVRTERFAPTATEAEAGAGFAVSYEVEAQIVDLDGFRTDCTTHPCVLFAADFSLVTRARAPISFDVAAGPVPATPTFTG